MFKTPGILGVRQIAPNNRPIGISTILESLGRNTGNMIFTESLNQILVSGKPVSHNLADEELVDRDAIVIAAANWINPANDLGTLADRIEKTNLPVFTVGIGAQSTLDKKIPRITAGTMKLLKVLSDRCATISTRGCFSSEVLQYYGIKNSVPTGCPSLLMAGRNGYMFTQSASLARVTLHGTRHNFNPAKGIYDVIYKEAFVRGYDILLQSETADMIVSNVADVSTSEQKNRATKFVRDAYGAENEEAAVSFLQTHGRYFTDYESWIAYLKTRTLCVGTRIHGTIASLIAGTPAVLVAHDSRTLELAEIMGIPHQLSSEIDTEKGLNIESFLDYIKMSGVNTKHTKYIETFEGFFSENNLRISL